MDLTLTLFFISLFGIIILLARRLWLAGRTGHAIAQESEAILIAPDFESVKYVTVKRLKRFGFIAVWITIRLSVRARHHLKQLWGKAATHLRSKIRQSTDTGEEREISRFLHAVSDYKKKIKKITQKIKEEEGLN